VTPSTAEAAAAREPAKPGGRGPAIAFEHVSLTLSGDEILRDVDLAIGASEVHCIIGPNGGGKTSLVRCLLGQMPHRGTIRIDWPSDERAIGYVPQSLDFDKTLPVTVGDFMAMISERRRPAFLRARRESRARTDAALERVGLAGKRRSKLGSLSGGERQRVLFAQALVPEPALVVLDEPMTSMDEIGEKVFLGLIRELAEHGVTVVWIAHDLAQVRAMADTVSCVNRRILFSGPPDAVLAERDAETLFRRAEALA
jgi:zinc transport system ATP-binding protein